LGFLSQRSKDLVIAEECLVCEKMLECMTVKCEAKTHQPETKLEFKNIEETKSIIIEEINENFEKPKTITRQVEKACASSQF
ncbi:MAG: hypothetical protein ACM3WQ_05150, partial [Chloroflexota bacterium]